MARPAAPAGTAHHDSLHVDGARLESRWWGPAPDDAPTLVLLHEGLGSVSHWRDFPARLAAATGWGVLAYSRAGYGASDPVPLPRPVRFMHHEALALPRVLDAAGVRRAVLLGHSDGASIALIAAAAADPRLLGLVLEAPHVFVEDVAVRSIAAAAEAFRTTDLREKLRRHHGDNVDVAFWGWNRVWLDPAFRDWNLEEYLPRIHLPTLLLQGEDDEYGTPAQLAAIRAGIGGPLDVHLLAHCGHAPHRDRPEAVLRLVTSFVSRLHPDT